MGLGPARGSPLSHLAELQERRAFECRLTRDRALQSLDEAGEFLRDRGMLTRTADSSLPSLFEACHEGPYAPGSSGFGSWPATKWPWFGELADRPGVFIVKVHNGKSLLVIAEVARLLDPICRAELERMHAADPQWALVIDHLGNAGPSEPGDLQLELGLKPRDLKAIRYPLERCGVIVSRGVVHSTPDGGHVHTSVLYRWDQAFPEPTGTDASLDDLLVAAVRAAVVAPEKELRRWFSWRWRFDDGLVDRLVTERRLERINGSVWTP